MVEYGFLSKISKKKSEAGRVKETLLKRII